MAKQIKIVLWLLLGCCKGVVYGQAKEKQRLALKSFEQAMVYFNAPAPNPQIDTLAVQHFRRVIALLRPDAANAPWLYSSYLNIGIITQTNHQQSQALSNYQQATALIRRFRLPDSLLYKPLLYAGTAHYNLYEIDSAMYYYKKAEQIFLRYPEISENQRLYNQIGVLYYDAGDYRQSINYYLKALQLSQKQASNKEAYISYMSNIASARRRLGEYDSAIAIYKKLLPLKYIPTILTINLGTAYLQKKEPQEALKYVTKLKQVEPAHRIKYEMVIGEAYSLLGQLPKAQYHLKAGLESYRQQQPALESARKNSDVGTTFKLLGDVALQQLRYQEALKYYQESMVQLSYAFHDKRFAHNPKQFNDGFKSNLLFESLLAKASCLEKLVQKDRNRSVMMMAVDTYRSVLLLATHIQKSLDTEESRLFILRKVFPVQQQAVALLIDAYEQTQERGFLELAFQVSEQSKASVLYIGRKENESKISTEIPDSLLRQERNLKFSLSQLFVEFDRATTAAEINRLKNTIRDKELALSRLADRLHEYPDYYRKKFGSDSLDLKYLQKRVLGSQKALISYFQTERQTFAFLLTKDGLTYRRIANDPVFRKNLTHLTTSLRTIIPGAPYNASLSAQYLYNSLIYPFESVLANFTSLIIIPHNDLNLLAFEVLEDQKQRFLLERFDVMYQYSVSFLRSEQTPVLSADRILAVAPFASRDMAGLWVSLPESGQEIANLPGTKLMRQEATKKKFLDLAQRASFIHLATHAIANNDVPSRSFIVFSPQHNQDNKLYAHELQYGFLAKAKLIFLSACETASGQLIRGEGLMSLSRAFSYAGCPNLITSLWKAEDHATAYLSAQFYAHLKTGETVARALQLAKLDLLNNGQYAQFRSPPYWAHLVFVGSPNDPGDDLRAIVLIISSSFILSIVGFFWWRGRCKKITEKQL